MKGNVAESIASVGMGFSYKRTGVKFNILNDTFRDELKEDTIAEKMVKS